MMTVLGRTARRRHAARLLWAWVFALFAGMANACVLGQGGLPAPHGPLQAAAHMHEHDAADHGHPDEAAAVPAPSSAQPPVACQKFCDDKGHALSPPAKDPGGPGDGLPLPASFILPAWTSGEARVLAGSARSMPARETGPPIPIRFLRLAI